MCEEPFKSFMIAKIDSILSLIASYICHTIIEESEPNVRKRWQNTTNILLSQLVCRFHSEV